MAQLLGENRGQQTRTKNQSDSYAARHERYSRARYITAAGLNYLHYLAIPTQAIDCLFQVSRAWVVLCQLYSKATYTHTHCLLVCKESALIHSEAANLKVHNPTIEQRCHSIPNLRGNSASRVRNDPAKSKSNRMHSLHRSTLADNLLMIDKNNSPRRARRHDARWYVYVDTLLYTPPCLDSIT